jgi:hypothetical protein
MLIGKQPSKKTKTKSSWLVVLKNAGNFFKRMIQSY